jgi:hypothetical protein
VKKFEKAFFGLFSRGARRIRATGEVRPCIVGSAHWAACGRLSARRKHFLGSSSLGQVPERGGKVGRPDLAVGVDVPDLDPVPGTYL